MTGGAFGIGRSLALALVGAEADVTILDRDPNAKDIAEETGVRAAATDLSYLGSRAGLDLGTEILVNCAGTQHVAPLESFPPEEFAFIPRRPWYVRTPLVKAQIAD